MHVIFKYVVASPCQNGQTSDRLLTPSQTSKVTGKVSEFFELFFLAKHCKVRSMTNVSRLPDISHMEIYWIFFEDCLSLQKPNPNPHAQCAPQDPGKVYGSQLGLELTSRRVDLYERNAPYLAISISLQYYTVQIFCYRNFATFTLLLTHCFPPRRYIYREFDLQRGQPEMRIAQNMKKTQKT